MSPMSQKEFNYDNCIVTQHESDYSEFEGSNTMDDPQIMSNECFTHNFARVIQGTGCTCLKKKSEFITTDLEEEIKIIKKTSPKLKNYNKEARQDVEDNHVDDIAETSTFDNDSCKLVEVVETANKTSERVSDRNLNKSSKSSSEHELEIGESNTFETGNLKKICVLQNLTIQKPYTTKNKRKSKIKEQKISSSSKKQDINVDDNNPDCKKELNVNDKVYKRKSRAKIVQENVKVQDLNVTSEGVVTSQVGQINEDSHVKPQENSCSNVDQELNLSRKVKRRKCRSPKATKIKANGKEEASFNEATTNRRHKQTISTNKVQVQDENVVHDNNENKHIENDLKKAKNIRKSATKTKKEPNIDVPSGRNLRSHKNRMVDGQNILTDNNINITNNNKEKENGENEVEPIELLSEVQETVGTRKRKVPQGPQNKKKPAKKSKMHSRCNLEGILDFNSIHMQSISINKVQVQDENLLHNNDENEHKVNDLKKAKNIRKNVMKTEKVQTTANDVPCERNLRSHKNRMVDSQTILTDNDINITNNNKEKETGENEIEPIELLNEVQETVGAPKRKVPHIKKKPAKKSKMHSQCNLEEVRDFNSIIFYDEPSCSTGNQTSIMKLFKTPQNISIIQDHIERKYTLLHSQSLSKSAGKRPFPKEPSNLVLSKTEADSQNEQKEAANFSESQLPDNETMFSECSGKSRKRTILSGSSLDLKALTLDTI